MLLILAGVFALAFSLDPNAMEYGPRLVVPAGLPPGSTTNFTTTLSATMLHVQTCPGIMCRFYFCLRMALTSEAGGEGVRIVPGHPWGVFCYHLLALFALLLRMFLGFELVVVVNRSFVHVTISRWAVISSRSLTGLRSLEFRILNDYGFGHELLEANVSVTMSFTPSKNPTKRRFYEIHLLRPQLSIMPVSANEGVKGTVRK